MKGLDAARKRLSLGYRASILALASAALSAPHATFAQTTTPPPRGPAPGTSAGELDPGSRVPRPSPRSNQGAFTPEPPGPCPLETSDVQVTLNSVSFRGSTVVSEGDLRAAYAEYLGSPQKVAVICAIRDRAARIIFESGVLARVEIPEQRIAGGALVLEVIEAHVVNVRVRGDVGPVQDLVERYAEKLRGMKPFDMARAQRYLLLASDVPGVRVRAAVRPSTSTERGAVDIDLAVSRKPPEAFGKVDNTGSLSVGRWSGLARVQFEGFTSRGETTTLTALSTLERNEQWLVQVAETARFGSEGLVGRASLTYGESHPGAALKPIDLASSSLVGGLEAAYPLVRTRDRNLYIATGIDVIDTRTTAGGQPFSRDNLRVLYARADGDFRTEAVGRPVLLSGALGVRQGVSALGASDRGDARLTRADGDPSAWVVRAQAGADMAISDRLVGMFRGQAQYAKASLFPYEQIAVGGLTVGRGYDPAALLGDKGITGGFELRYGPWQLHPQVAAAPYGFFEMGYIANNNVSRTGAQKDRTLKSVGAGVIFRLFNRANLEVTYARPLDSVRPGAARPTDRVLIQLTASLL